MAATANSLRDSATIPAMVPSGGTLGPCGVPRAREASAPLPRKLHPSEGTGGTLLRLLRATSDNRAFETASASVSSLGSSGVLVLKGLLLAKLAVVAFVVTASVLLGITWVSLVAVSELLDVAAGWM